MVYSVYFATQNTTGIATFFYLSNNQPTTKQAKKVWCHVIHCVLFIAIIITRRETKKERLGIRVKAKFCSSQKYLVLHSFKFLSSPSFFFFSFFLFFFFFLFFYLFPSFLSLLPFCILFFFFSTLLLLSSADILPLESFRSRSENHCIVDRSSPVVFFFICLCFLFSVDQSVVLVLVLDATTLPKVPAATISTTHYPFLPITINTFDTKISTTKSLAR